MMGFLVGGPRFEICGRVRAFTFASSLRLCLCDGVPCVINRIGFILRAVVGDALDNDFGVVAAGEGALGVGPVGLRFGECAGACVCLFVSLPAFLCGRSMLPCRASLFFCPLVSRGQVRLTA